MRRERDSQARLPAHAETTPRHLVTRPDILEADVTEATLTEFVLDHTARGSEARTDGWQG